MTRNDPTQSSREPQVGIVYLVKDKLWVDGTPLSQADSYGDFKIHERDHQVFWQELVGRGLVPDDLYEEHPRGRVVYKPGVDQYTLYLDPCILKETDVVCRILTDMHLPKSKTMTKTDSHYRCFRCLAGSEL